MWGGVGVGGKLVGKCYGSHFLVIDKIILIKQLRFTKYNCKISYTLIDKS